jgi:diamine N-acetyltransferase
MADHPPPAVAPPNKDSVLTLREIDEHNWRAVTRLSVHEKQRGNLASNAMSLLESHYSEDAWVRAVYVDGDTMVGFLMMAIWDPDEAYYIWRFMIDHRFQGLGYGRRVVGMAIAHIRQHNPRAKILGVMSTPPEGKRTVKREDSPFKFYERLGFKQVEPPDEDGEIMMHIDLEPDKHLPQSQN